MPPRKREQLEQSSGGLKIRRAGLLDGRHSGHGPVGLLRVAVKDSLMCQASLLKSALLALALSGHTQMVLSVLFSTLKAPGEI